METDVRKLLQSLAASAASAAEEVRDAVTSAKNTVAEKYDVAKLSMTHTRLQTQQERLFTEIGRAMFLLRAKALPETAPEGEKTPRQMLESLLVNAEQVQQELDAVAEKMSAAKSEHVCPLCGRVCPEHDAFCATCGAKL